MAITFRHFVNMLTGRTKVTMQYPEQKWDAHMPEHYRGAPALVKDERGRVRCVACQLCEFICPPRAIKIVPALAVTRLESHHVVRRARLQTSPSPRAPRPVGCAQ